MAVIRYRLGFEDRRFSLMPARISRAKKEVIGRRILSKFSGPLVRDLSG
jgi:hypothetical protein